MNHIQTNLDQLGVSIDAQLFGVAMTHRSYAFENEGNEHNERLEFLGDAVLQIVITEHLFTNFPDSTEGQLATMRASLVNTRALAAAARAAGLGPLIRLGRGEIATGGADKDSILADTTEALIGAAYVSTDLAAAARLVHWLLADQIAAVGARNDYTDAKTALQEYCAERDWPRPTYEVIGSGPDHQRSFTAVAIVNEQQLGKAEASSKKRAEQAAARQAWEALQDGADA